MVRPILETLTQEQRHRLLADELRRFVIEIFGESGGPFEASLGELASDIDRTHPDIGARLGRDDLLVRLHHVHLPMLADVGLIEYDRDSKRIRIVESEAAAHLVSEPTA